MFWMLKILREAAETYLEASRSTVEVVFQFLASESLFDTLRSACSSLSLGLILFA